MTKQKKLFKYKVPELEKFIGRTVDVKGEKVKIKTVVGNVGMTLGRAAKDVRPQYLEINGKYLISMLRFFAQMEGATDITEEQFKQFEETEFWSEKMGDEDEEVKNIVDGVMAKAKEKGEKK